MNLHDKNCISVDQLLELMQTKQVVLFDASNHSTAKENYEKEHLQGAFFVDVNTDLATIDVNIANGGRHPLPQLSDFLQTVSELGISSDSTVVIYDDKNGANAAARFWWMLKAIGLQNVLVLDGGFQAAKENNFPLESGWNKPQTAPKITVSEWDLPTITREELSQQLLQDTVLLIDVREEKRFNGEYEPIDLVAGHIPGATNIPFTHNLDTDGKFKSAKDLYELYHSKAEAQSLVVHCGSGVTACHTILAFALAGLKIPTLYVGSWSEWSRNGL